MATSEPKALLCLSRKLPVPFPSHGRCSGLGYPGGSNQGGVSSWIEMERERSATTGTYLLLLQLWRIAPAAAQGGSLLAKSRTMASSDDGVEVESNEGVASDVGAGERAGAPPLASADSPGKDNKEKESGVARGVEAAVAAEEQVEEIP